jgi:hypothetical protein
MSGGKGGSTSSTVTIPQYIEDAAKANLAKAEEISKIGDVRYYGPDVAAFTPMQQAAFQGTADLASAFGTAGGGMSQQDVMGGMPAPTIYASGVQGYSSAPMFEQSMAELEARRPGQYAAINAPFIDPVTGAQPAAPYGTGGVDASGPFGTILAGAGGAAPGGAAPNSGSNNDDDFHRQMMANASNQGAGNSGGFGLSPSGRISAALPGGADDRNLGRPVNQFIAGATSPTQQSGDPTSSLFPVGRSAHSQYDPSTQSLTLGNSGGGGGTDSAGRDSSSCVVATHAVNSGAFSPATKREAVVWCMNALHGKWWGEAVRRGYRYCGNKKIEQGKAREHYGEFRRYIDFASGKKRTLRGALTFTLRTAQFFAVGLVKRGA